MGPSPNKRHKIEPKTKTNERATMTIKRCKPKHLMESCHSKAVDHHEKNIQTKVSNFKMMPTTNKKDEGVSHDTVNNFRMYDRKPNTFHYGDSSSSSRTSFAHSTDAYKSSLQSFHCDSFDESISSLCRCYPSSLIKRNHSQINMPSRSAYSLIDNWKNNDEVISKSRMENVLVSGRNKQLSFSSRPEKNISPISTFATNRTLDQTNKRDLKMSSINRDNIQYAVDRNSLENNGVCKSSSDLQSVFCDSNQILPSSEINSCPEQHQNLSYMAEISSDEQTSGDKRDGYCHDGQNVVSGNSKSVKFEMNQNKEYQDKVKSDLICVIPGNGDGNEKLIAGVSLDNQSQTKKNTENLSCNYPHNEVSENSITEAVVEITELNHESRESQQAPSNDPSAFVTNVNLENVENIEEEHSSKEKIILKDSASQTEFEYPVMHSENQYSIENKQGINNVADNLVALQGSNSSVQGFDFLGEHQNSQSEVIEIANDVEMESVVKTEHDYTLQQNVNGKDSVNIKPESTFQDGENIDSLHVEHEPTMQHDVESKNSVKVEHKSSLQHNIESRDSVKVEDDSNSQHAAESEGCVKVENESTLQQIVESKLSLNVDGQSNLQHVESKGNINVEYESSLQLDIVNKDSVNVEYEPAPLQDIESTDGINVELESSFQQDIEIKDESIFRHDVGSKDSVNEKRESTYQQHVDSKDELNVKRKFSFKQEVEIKDSANVEPVSTFQHLASKNSKNVDYDSTFKQEVIESGFSLPIVQQNVQPDSSKFKKNGEIKGLKEEGDHNTISQLKVENGFHPSDMHINSQIDVVQMLREIVQKHDLNNKQVSDIRLMNDNERKNEPPKTHHESLPDRLMRTVESASSFKLRDFQYTEQDASNIDVIHVSSHVNNRDLKTVMDDSHVDKNNAGNDIKATKAVEQSQYSRNESEPNKLQGVSLSSSSFVAPNEGQLPLPPWVEPMYTRKLQSPEIRRFDISPPNSYKGRNEEDDTQLNLHETLSSVSMKCKEKQHGIRACPSCKEFDINQPNCSYPFGHSSELRNCSHPLDNIPFESMSCSTCCCHAYKSVPPTVNPGQLVYQVCPVFPLYLNNAVEMVCHVPNNTPSMSRVPYGVNVIPFPSANFPNIPHNQGIIRGQNRYVQLETNDEYNFANRGMQHWNQSGPLNMRPAGLRSDETERWDNSSRNADTQRPTTSKVQRPFIICYICGREFGSASIGIHEKQCLQKWQTENGQLPKHMQRKDPIKPQVLGQKESDSYSDDATSKIPGSGKASYNLDALNDAAFASSQAQNVKCDKCGRTFAPDRLDLHRKNCRGFHKIV